MKSVGEQCSMRRWLLGVCTVGALERTLFRTSICIMKAMASSPSQTPARAQQSFHRHRSETPSRSLQHAVQPPLLSPAPAVSSPHSRPSTPAHTKRPFNTCSAPNRHEGEVSQTHLERRLLLNCPWLKPMLSHVANRAQDLGHLSPVVMPPIRRQLIHHLAPQSNMMSQSAHGTFF